MNAPSEGPAVITLREVYDLVLEVRSEVTLLKSTELKSDVADHETRIRALERWIWRASGIAAAIGAAGGYIVTEVFGKMGTP